MKTVRLLIPMVLLAAVAGAQTKPAAKSKQPAAKTTAPVPQTAAPVTGTPTDAIYEYLVLKHTDDPAPEGYGLKADMLIPVGIYVNSIGDEKKINQQLSRFFKSLLWADGAPVIWLSRSTSMINSVNVEQFKVTKAGSKDTVTLFVDEYNNEPIKAPKGFKFYTKQQMLAEFTPILQEIRAYNALPDKFGNAAAKATSFKLVGYMQSNIGLDYLLDQDMIGPLINEVSIDLDLKAYLIRSYLFHKFENEITGNSNPKIAAFNAVVDDYEAVMKIHNVTMKGNLASYMVKK